MLKRKGGFSLSLYELHITQDFQTKYSDFRSKIFKKKIPKWILFPET